MNVHYAPRCHADCRTQHGTNRVNAGNAIYAVSRYIGHPISFPAVNAQTAEVSLQPFGLTDEPAGTSGVLHAFGCVRGDEKGDSLFVVEEKPAQPPGVRAHIVAAWHRRT